jgi:hypothetical protein
MEAIHAEAQQMANMIARSLRQSDPVRVGEERERQSDAPISGVFGRRARVVSDRVRMTPQTAVGALEIAIFFVAVVLFYLATGHSNPAGSQVSSWLVASALLWVCTSPAWLFRPNRYEIKRLFVSGTAAFVCIASAVLVGVAIEAQMTSGML